MAAIPLSYNLRNLIVRWKNTLMTAVSIALVVAVFIIIMSLAQGLRTAFTSTGNPHNLLVLRKGSNSETTSFITMEQFQILKNLQGVDLLKTGEPMVTGELLTLMNLPRKDGKNANVIIRGVLPNTFFLRDGVTLSKGQLFKSGLRECIISRTLASRFKNMEIGDSLRIGKGYYKVVGHFDAQGTAFGSEIWAGIHQVGADFDRPEYSNTILRVSNPNQIQKLIRRIDNDRSLSLNARPEPEYYAEQTKTALPIQIFGSFLAVIMSIGAVFAALNTMYAAVANRTREIGTLRVLGFTPLNIMVSFMFESILLSLIGGILGCLFSLPIDGLATGTVNFDTFSEIAFNFRITPVLLGKGILFSLFIGFMGGVLPSIYAARRLVISALRELE